MMKIIPVAAFLVVSASAYKTAHVKWLAEMLNYEADFTIRAAILPRFLPTWRTNMFRAPENKEKLLTLMNGDRSQLLKLAALLNVHVSEDMRKKMSIVKSSVKGAYREQFPQLFEKPKKSKSQCTKLAKVIGKDIAANAGIKNPHEPREHRWYYQNDGFHGPLSSEEFGQLIMDKEVAIGRAGVINQDMMLDVVGIGRFNNWQVLDKDLYSDNGKKPFSLEAHAPYIHHIVKTLQGRRRLNEISRSSSSHPTLRRILKDIDVANAGF